MESAIFSQDSILQAHTSQPGSNSDDLIKEREKEKEKATKKTQASLERQLVRFMVSGERVEEMSSEVGECSEGSFEG